jgi:hypothetical protein
MVTPAEAAPAKSFSAAAAVVLLSREASPLTASWTAGCTRSPGTNCRGTRGRCLLTITHWLVGSLRENFWDKTPDGGAFDGGAAVAVGDGATEATCGVVVAVGEEGVAVWRPETEGAGAWEATGESGVQAAKAVIPTPATSSVVNDLRLGRQS